MKSTFYNIKKKKNSKALCLFIQTRALKRQCHANDKKRLWELIKKCVTENKAQNLSTPVEKSWTGVVILGLAAGLFPREAGVRM